MALTPIPADFGSGGSHLSPNGSAGSPSLYDILTEHYNALSTTTATSWKTAVRIATTANGTLATAYANGQTVDGVVLATGDRILLKNQTTGSENGIYTVNASGAPTRSTDSNTGALMLGAAVAIEEGTTNQDTTYLCTTNAPITIGSTSLTFATFGGSAGITSLTTDVTASGTGAVAATIARSITRSWQCKYT